MLTLLLYRHAGPYGTSRLDVDRRSGIAPINPADDDCLISEGPSG